jgi:hypothetical protein
MHHTDIGRIIEVLEDFFLTTDTPAPITIAPITPVPGNRSSYYGINIVVRWADSQLIAEINEADKDSNETKLHFYLQVHEPKPSLSVKYSFNEFNGDPLRLFFKTSLQISKGKLDLSRMKPKEFFYQTNLTPIEQE